MPRSDYTHKMVNGEQVPLTEAEINECVAREEAWAAGASARALKQFATNATAALLRLTTLRYLTRPCLLR